MLRPLSIRHAARAMVAMLGLTLPGCSADDLASPQPDFTFTGRYALSSIGEGRPGQLIRISNPDGSVVGFYRFVDGTLELHPGGAFTVRIEYEDDTKRYTLEDQGQYTWHSVQGGVRLDFSSETHDDEFDGAATPDGSSAFDYDFDGSGETDTRFGFRQGTAEWKWVDHVVNAGEPIAKASR